LTDRGLEVNRTALVKLIYLADVEALRLGLPRISDLEWIFYKYGPYAFEFDRALQELVGADTDEFAGVSGVGRSFYAYRRSPYPQDADAPVEAKAVINRTLDRWGGESLNRLLNYVYFETEPMQEAEWGKPLNLGTVQRRHGVVASVEDRARLAFMGDGMPLVTLRVADLQRLKEEFRSRVSTRSADSVRPSPSPRYDEVFFEGLRAADEDG
jgi:hypothetical protein